MDAQPALHGNVTPLDALVELLPFGVLVMDPSGSAYFANRAWTELTGQAEADWRLEGWALLFRPNERSGRRDEMLDAARSGSVYTADWQVAAAGGTPRTLQVVAVPDTAGGEGLVAIVVTASNVTAERRQTTKLKELATRDDLTGLYNRGQFATFVERALRRRRRDPTLNAAVFFLDVDDLKTTNDTYGHDAGDRLLTTIADRITDAVRPGDIVARYGGDEFAVLCDDLHDDAEAAIIADRIRSAMLAPYAGEGSCSASLGVAAANGHVRAQSLLDDADRAMYQEKRSQSQQADPQDQDTLAAR